MPKRQCYYEQYKHLSSDWGISNDKVIELINKYDRQLIEEILDDTPLTLSRYFKDKRSDHEYYFDLLGGRLVEEFVKVWFEEQGSVVEKFGSDSDGRIIRSGSVKITTNPDLLVDSKQVEIQVSRAGKRKTYHVKEGKGKKILRQECTLMFVIINEYFIVDKSIIDISELKPNSAWGGKICYEIINPVYKLMKG